MSVILGGRAAGAEERAVVPHTIGGVEVPEEPDGERLRRDRSVRLRAEMERREIDALIVLGTSNVHYATGAAMPSVDASTASLMRPVAVVRTDNDHPHLFTPYPEGARDRLPDDHVHPPLFVDIDDERGRLSALDDLIRPTETIGSDEVTIPLREWLGERRSANGASVLGAARITKTPDEVACMRTAQRINEAAMSATRPRVTSGAKQAELTGCFLSEVFARGGTGVGIDTIWQVMPRSLDDGPWTVHGDVAYPTPPTDRTLVAGDVMWVDSGILHEGYPSDFGRTWIVDAEPDDRQRAQFRRWVEVMDACLGVIEPGITGGDLCRTAIAADESLAPESGRKPWLDHFYVSHGLGVDSAEMPLFGTDLGADFDDSVALAPGMILVLEPVIWDDGHGGYRSEDIVAITDSGWMPLSDHPYDGFEDGL